LLLAFDDRAADAAWAFVFPAPTFAPPLAVTVCFEQGQDFVTVLAEDDLILTRQAAASTMRNA